MLQKIGTVKRISWLVDNKHMYDSHSHNVVRMVAADGLASSCCQPICNHHSDVGGELRTQIQPYTRWHIGMETLSALLDYYRQVSNIRRTSVAN